jgi:hypothetical protein
MRDAKMAFVHSRMLRLDDLKAQHEGAGRDTLCAASFVEFLEFLARVADQISVPTTEQLQELGTTVRLPSRPDQSQAVNDVRFAPLPYHVALRFSLFDPRARLPGCLRLYPVRVALLGYTARYAAGLNASESQRRVSHACKASGRQAVLHRLSEEGVAGFGMRRQTFLEYVRRVEMGTLEPIERRASATILAPSERPLYEKLGPFLELVLEVQLAQVGSVGFRVKHSLARQHSQR